MDVGQVEQQKVKQVTFKPLDDGNTEKPPKKIRLRMKGIMKQLKIQMEFYFGDSNMSKDRFMKQQLDNSPDGYLPLTTFMNFNKIKELTEKVEILAKALQSSELLQVSEDGTKVKRTTPVKYLTKEEVDTRTIYVEGFLKNTTREWLTRKFSQCGRVTYVSLPRYSSTNDSKGFAFIEFETPEEAAKAIEKLNHVPEKEEDKLDEKIGASVKQSCNLRYLKKRAAKEGIEVEEMDAGKIESGEEGRGKGDVKESKKSKSKKKKKKRRSTLGEGPVFSSTKTHSGLSESNDSITEKSAADADKSELCLVSDNIKIKKSKKSKKRKKRTSSHSLQTSEKVDSEIYQTAQESNASVELSGNIDLEKNVGCLEISQNDPDSIRKSKPSKVKQAGKAEDSPNIHSELCKNPQGTGDSDNGINFDGSTRTNSSCKSSQSCKKRTRSPEDDSQGSSAKIFKKDKTSEKECGDHIKKDDESFERQSVDLAKESIKGNKKSNVRQESANENKPPNLEPAKGDNDCSLRNSKGSVTQDSDIQKASRKRKADVEDIPLEDDQMSKKWKGKQSDQPKRSLEQLEQPATVEGRKRKRRSLEASEDGTSRKRRSLEGNEDVCRRRQKRNPGSASEDGSKVEEVERAGMKKRHRKKHRLQEQPLKLRVMGKKEWVCLKDEYLSLQKTNMKKLKEQLKAAACTEKKRSRQNSGDTQNGQDSNTGHPVPQFVPDVILEVKSEVGMCHQSIRADIDPSIDVAYVDVKPGVTKGHIRCKDAESAVKLLQTGIKECSLSLLDGEAEKQYWKKLITDRESRLSETKRPKRRGKNKLLQRAQNPLGEIFVGQHLKFNEEEEKEHDADAVTGQIAETSAVAD